MSAVRKLLGLCLLGAASSAFAIDPVRQQDGFGGFFRLGLGVSRVASNMVAGSFFNSLSEGSIDSINDSPDHKTSAGPVFDLYLGYTLPSRTEIFLGRELVDVFRFDLSTGLGVKQELPDRSTIGATLLFPSFPTKVYQDPYEEGRQRNETDRTAPGVRLAWRDILGTTFEARYTYRDIDIDNEDSGNFLVGQGRLSRLDQDLLDRNGDYHEAQLLFRWRITDNHRLTPALLYTYNDLDGRAMKNDSLGVQLTYGYAVNDRPVLIANLFYAEVDYDERNPIYNKKQEDDRYGAGLQYLYHNPLGFDRWTAVFGLSYYEEDANISFYDSDVLTGAVSAAYNF
jgi:hypothetical protein